MPLECNQFIAPRNKWQDVSNKDKKDSIEHILPQDPSREYWKERWSQEKVQKYLHDIGNLTLTQDNSAFGNKTFPDKRGYPGTKGYYDSIMFQERELARWEDWTEKELIERRKMIVDWAIKRWAFEQQGADDGEDTELPEEEPEFEEISEDEEDILEENSWEHSEILSYLGALEEGRFHMTLNYFRALASSDKPITFRELLSKLSELKGRNLSGRVMAGVWSGIYKMTKKTQKERLDLLNDAEDQYSLKPKYKDIVRGFFDR